MFNKLLVYSALTSSISLALSATFFWLPQHNKTTTIEKHIIHEVQAAPITNTNTIEPTFVSTQAAPKIQVAILLDTSSSMSGLINQTRTELWSVINALGEAHKNNVRPTLEIALYEYGQSSLPFWSRQIRQVSSFTTDLDQISEGLFALHTDGGEEYSGAVIQKAASDLLWSETNDDLKVIFIAGNEPFNQGPVPFPEAISQAVGKDIIINTIHCGDHGVGIQENWQMGASLGKGEYFAIDQNQEVAYIETPFDEQIAQYNLQLNETYIAYGSHGSAGKQRQVAEDMNSNQSRKSYISRSLSKSSAYYSNDSWDIVDASAQSSFSWSDIPEEDLPDMFKNKSTAEKEALINAFKEKREAIKKEMARLKVLREEYILVNTPKQADNTLGAAVIKALKKQAAQKQFVL